MPNSLQKVALILLAMMAGFFANAQGDHKDHPHRSCATMEVYNEQNRRDPTLASKRAAMEKVIQHYISSSAGQRTQSATITIPVVVHVVYNTSAQNISDAQIQSQIDILNQDYARLNADASNVPSDFTSVAASADIQFCLAKRTPTGTSTNGITRTYTSVTSFTQNDAVKRNSTGGEDAWDASKYLNLWVCNFSGQLLGYAQFPGGSAATDGVVIGYKYFGNQGTATAPFNLGRTASHEVGHWLNLFHIWGDATCGDDLVSDTPTQLDANYGCPTYPHPTCSNNSDMFMNYMDYTDDACMCMFTAGQASRMRAAVSASRPGLLTSDGCVPSTIYCTGLTTTVAPNGTISDGSASSNYNDNSSCQWLIQPVGATSFTITFTSFNTEATNDVVTIYNGTNASGTVVGTYSGSTIPSAINVTGSAVYVTFTSNGSVTDAGWSFDYTSVIVPTGCSGLTTYTASSGTVNDGSGSGNYPNNSNCQFLIQPSGGQTYISLYFSYFDTEASWDFVSIYNGNSTSAPLIASFSGTDITPVIVGDAGAIYVTFTSDGLTNATGWEFDYNCSNIAPSNSCLSYNTFTTSSGTFTDGSGPNDYLSSRYCDWLIKPSVTAQSIAISFSDFATEQDYDSLQIFAGNAAVGTPVATFSGGTLPSVTTINGPAAFVVFTSDGSIQDAGWTLNYTSVATSVASAQLDGNVSVYPNPAEDELIIKANINNASALNCKLLNSYGQQIWMETFNQSQIEFSASLAGLPSGMYYVQITDNNGRSKMEKLVKK